MPEVTRFARQHLKAFIATAAAVAAVVGSRAVLVGAPPASASRQRPPIAGPPGATQRGVKGRVTAIDGGTWTVTTAYGETMIVTVNPSTQFGTMQAPTTAGNFTVGENIIATGRGSAGTMSAVRIAPA